MSVAVTVLVVDCQGGGLGKAIIERLKREANPPYIIAAGTNAMATGSMIKAGADAFATGENAVIYNAGQADIIIGGIGIISANAMMGEISPSIAHAISGSTAIKILIPLNKCNLKIAGVADMPLSQKIDDAVETFHKICCQ